LGVFLQAHVQVRQVPVDDRRDPVRVVLLNVPEPV
jgi:hypothetical protein